MFEILSVPKTKRGKSKLEVIIKSRQLASYTLKITQNENNFPKRYRSFVRDEISEVAVNISARVYEANSIRVITVNDYNERRALQKEALRLTYRLLNNIAIWHRMHRIDNNHITFWSESIMDVQSLIRSWRDADSKRYQASLAFDSIKCSDDEDI